MKVSQYNVIVKFLKKSMYPPHGRSSEIPSGKGGGGGVLEAKRL